MIMHKSYNNKKTSSFSYINRKQSLQQIIFLKIFVIDLLFIILLLILRHKPKGSKEIFNSQSVNI